MSKVTDEQLEAACRGYNHTDPNAQFASRVAMRAALEAASSTPDGEAVAWRVRERPGFDWRFIDGNPDRDFSLNGYEKQPLYTHPAPIKDGVTVKALEWGSERRYGFLIHEGRGAGYTYEAAAKAYGPGWIMTLGLTTIFDGPDADEAAAKAAAQADFDTRILSCLSHNEIKENNK